jgi:hypothetical protein
MLQLKEYSGFVDTFSFRRRRMGVEIFCELLFLKLNEKFE